MAAGFACNIAQWQAGVEITPLSLKKKTPQKILVSLVNCLAPTDFLITRGSPSTGIGGETCGELWLNRVFPAVFSLHPRQKAVANW